MSLKRDHNKGSILLATHSNLNITKKRHLLVRFCLNGFKSGKVQNFGRGVGIKAKNQYCLPGAFTWWGVVGNQRNLSGGFTGWLKLMFASLHQLCIMSSASWPRQLPLHLGCELISLRLLVPEPFLKRLQEGVTYTQGIVGGQSLPLFRKLKCLCWLHYLSFFSNLICRFHCFLALFLDRSLFNTPYFWLGWVFTAVCRLSLVAVSRGYSAVVVPGFSLWASPFTDGL